MKISFGYIRRSSYKQQQNNSIEIQKQHIQEFAKRNNIVVPDELIFIEDVTSAYSKRADQRKELMRLSEKMIELKIPTVIFHDVSRMDRTGYSFTIDFYRPLLKKLPSLEIYTTKSNEPIDPESMEIKMSFLLFQHESEVKSERAIGSIVNDLIQDSVIRPGSKTPFGYNQMSKKLYPNENAIIVSFIFFLHSWGHSLLKIASLLNEAAIPSPRGKEWGSSTIENIIKNPVYIGNLKWHIPKRKDGQKIFLFEDVHEPIVDDFLLQLQRQNILLQKKYGRLDTPFLFLNKITCQECHKIMDTKNSSTKRNGVQYHYQNYICKECNYKVSATELHERFLPMILDRVGKLVVKKQINEETKELLHHMIYDVSEMIIETENRIENLTKKLVLAKDLEDRELELQILSSIEHYREKLNEQQCCIENLNETLKAIESNQFFSRFHLILHQQLDLVEKRLIILYFVDQILLSPKRESHINYKTNIFSEFVPAING
ncbi:recombinase family protein [Bacillus sp. AGMB 02131]|uniref:Recombinase family protein n=1 Tax=Peribacillus faecalis TaxID=2772559 RepID=A0A927CWJ1_9BACI|nr:recombinase family protein [Peribacillus faecalis]MBD3108057.1 recombinase family protein [Peribacillus faecalis]